ncbi:YybH family protein [Bosea eneae]|uniref:YybH family protein n=1 Tax=Bosea eneae TaxID=151454 RepID=A0ABW0J1H2_9HYPH
MAVKAVLSAYKSAVENLDASGAVQLFAEDSTVFENGTSEGTFSHYLGHHLGPELREVRAFRYSDHSVIVKVEGAMAVASETYRFRIEPKHGEPIERQGVATSALRKEGGRGRFCSIITPHAGRVDPDPGVLVQYNLLGASL